MISIKGLTYKIDNKTIIDNLMIEFTQKVSVIVGRSGSGKTQLLKQIIVNNDSIISSNTNYGYMPQDLLLFDWYSIYDNLNIVNKNNVDINELLKEFNLEHLIKKYPKELSGGEQSRVAFLRAYIMSEEYIILDEPFSKLDYITHQEIMIWLKKIIYKHDKKIILVTHNLDEALFLADEIFILNDRATLNSTLTKPFNDQDKDFIISKLINKLERD